jgi:hypothetical protein
LQHAGLAALKEVLASRGNMEEEPPVKAEASSSAEEVDNDVPRDSWVQCDGCSKWRRIPQSLANELGDHAQWHCKDNPNPAFASCSTPQELTNEEIDEEQAEDSDVRHCIACMHAKHSEPPAARASAQQHSQGPHAA